jgi:hypothetical protein
MCHGDPAVQVRPRVADPRAQLDSRADARVDAKIIVMIEKGKAKCHDHVMKYRPLLARGWRSDRHDRGSSTPALHILMRSR